MEVRGRREDEDEGVVAAVHGATLPSAVDDAVTVGAQIGVVVMTMATVTVEAPMMARM